MVRMLCVGAVVLLVMGGAAWADPWADQVVRYSAGDATDFTDSTVVLGEPSRTTWESVNWPSTQAPVAVRVTEAPWTETQILKVGNGGELVVSFDEAVENDPHNPWGLDLLVFTNLGVASADWPTNDVVDSSGFAFGGLLGSISVSQDDVTWYRVASLGTTFPMQAYMAGASDAFATGATATDYTLPVDPGLTMGDLAGLTVGQVATLYNGSGGGLGIDLSNLLDGSGNPASLDWIRYVRIEGATNAVDAFADVAAVPEPATLSLLGLGLAGLVLRRRRSR